MDADGHAGIAGRTIVALIGLALSAGVLTACSAGTARSCDEQATLANALADDEVFSRISVSSRSTEEYTNYPCQDNSGGSLVTAGKRYGLQRSLTFEGLRDLATRSASSARWRPIAEIRPTDPGSGNDAHLCYRSATGEEPQYLRFHTTQSEPFYLYVEVSQAENEVEMCPKPG